MRIAGLLYVRNARIAELRNVRIAVRIARIAELRIAVRIARIAE